MNNFRMAALPLRKGYVTHGYVVYDSTKETETQAVARAMEDRLSQCIEYQRRKP